MGESMEASEGPRMRDYEDRPMMRPRPMRFNPSADIFETSEMLEGIEAIVLSIADRVDQVTAMVATLCDSLEVRER